MEQLFGMFVRRRATSTIIGMVTTIVIFQRDLRLHTVSDIHLVWRTQVLSGSSYRGGFLMRSKNIYGTLSNGQPGSPGNAGTYEQKQVTNPGAPAAARDPTQGTILENDCGEW